MSKVDIVVPDIGDARDVEVAELLVAVGDVVELDDPLLVLESDKASVEVPATAAGTVLSIEVSVGDLVEENQVIVRVEAADAADADADADDAEGSDADEASGDQDSPEDGAAADETAAASRKATSEEATSEEAPTEVASAKEASGDEASPPAGSATVDVRVPDVGDAGEVIVSELLAKVGDALDADDGIVVLESDKASMEITAPQAGVLKELAVSEGDEVEQDTLIARLEVVGGDGGGDADAGSKQPEAAGEKPTAEASAAEAEPAKAEPPKDSAEHKQSASAGKADSSDSDGADGSVYAGPAVRRMARELGVELRQVSGSGARGRIVKEDVQGFVKSALSGGGGDAGRSGGIEPIPVIDFSQFGPVSEEKVSRVMQVGARNLHRSWVNLPHVTHIDEADITELESFRKSLADEAKAAGVRLTPLAFLVKAAVAALQAFPRFNASLGPDRKVLILKQYYHIGMAVDTPSGLVVPVIKDADQKGIYELAGEIAELAERARELKLKPGEMQGGTFSISSLGPLGGTAFTPIINAPEVAILGVAKLATKPVWDGSQFVPRKMLPLCLSYDHRVINGADAARFVTFYMQVINDIRRLVL